MEDLVQQKLKDVIARFGYSICEDDKRCEAILKDLCNNNKKEIFILISSLREKITEDLLKAKDSGLPIELLIAKLDKRLQDNLAFTPDISKWALETWAFALGINFNKQVKKDVSIHTEPEITYLNEKKSKPIETQSKVINIPENFVYVEGGTFQMGSNDTESDDWEKPVHSVTVSSFYLGKYQVTQQEYQDLIGSNPSYFKGSNLPVEKVNWFDAIKACNARSKKENIPVAYDETTGELLDISGHVTTDITKAKGYRLPTEAEWEYAAKGGNKSQWYKYSGSNNVDEVAWYHSNSGEKILKGFIFKKEEVTNHQTHPVGTKKPNELGIYDMSGNVWEWTTDLYSSYSNSSYSSSDITNPYMSSGDWLRVVRGGGWSNNVIGKPSYRSRNSPSANYGDIGFRFCRTL